MIARNPHAPLFRSLPVPGLRRDRGRYAECVGTLTPVLHVDPTVSGKHGEEALIAHEACHAIERHGLQAAASLGIGFAFFCAAVVAVAMSHWSYDVLCAAFLLWLGNHLVFLRHCEVEADRYAMEATSPNEFVAFLHLHPHPKGRWGRWLYGASREARIRRILPKP